MRLFLCSRASGCMWIYVTEKINFIVYEFKAHDLMDTTCAGTADAVIQNIILA